MKRFLPIIVFVVVVVAILAIGYSANKKKNASSSNDQVATTSGTEPATSGEVKGASTDTSGIDPVALAKYLTSKGAIFYGASWCSHCQAQKESFGEDAMKYVPYVECSPNGSSAPQAEQCTAAGVTGYPTWDIGGQKVSGTQTLSKLAELSGFKN